MEGWVGMAGDTGSWRAFKLSVGMTSRAFQVGMAASQREVGTAVIKRGIIPIIGRMTGRAIRTELPVMLIILLMAGEAICGRVFEHIVDMTLLAFNISMLTFKFESGKVMVKIGRRPTFG